jgi:N-acetylglucosaminyl-diphospho-decaprenol L-rhamnosyltransferase
MEMRATPKPMAGSEPVSIEPLISVIVLNYNGKAWMHRCLESLRSQTIFDQIEVLVADNASTDGSDTLSQELLAGWPNGYFIQNGENIGFGAGSNRAVARAKGKHLFFLNPDVWLEPDCLEKLYDGTEAAGAGAAGLLVMDYDDNSIQSRGGVGFDWLGIAIPPRRGRVPYTLFAACGFYFIRTDLFRRIGGYENHFFLYGEEADLSWRVWIAGERIIHVPEARMHHRGAALANPKGGTKIVEVRTSELKRFYANRNDLIIILKNCQHILLILALPYCLWMTAESLAGALLIRRLSFFRKACLAALADCWRLRGYIVEQRRQIKAIRKRSDFWMLRFFSPRFSRWEDIARIFRLGLPKVDRSELPRG